MCGHRRRTTERCTAFEAEASKLRYKFLSLFCKPVCPVGVYTSVNPKMERCRRCRQTERIQRWERDVDRAFGQDAIVHNEAPRTEDIPSRPARSTASMPAPNRYSWLDRKPLPPLPERESAPARLGFPAPAPSMIGMSVEEHIEETELVWQRACPPTS
jgi:hypothetical protein